MTVTATVLQNRCFKDIANMPVLEWKKYIMVVHA